MLDRMCMHLDGVLLRYSACKAHSTLMAGRHKRCRALRDGAHGPFCKHEEKEWETRATEQTHLPMISRGGARDKTKRILVPLVSNDSGNAGLAPGSIGSLAVLFRAERRRVRQREGHRVLARIAVDAVVGAARRRQRDLLRGGKLSWTVDSRDVERLFGLAHLARMKIGGVAGR